MPARPDPLSKAQVADILDEIGTLLELRGENKFKCIAFHNAARVLTSVPGELAQLIATKELYNVKGIGKGIAAEIIELVEKGSSTAHKELLKATPPGLLQIMRLQGLGPKKVRILHEKLKIKDIAGLKKAALAHKLADLDGFGAKTETNILASIERLSRHADKHLYSEARRAADEVLEAVRKFPGVLACEAAGSVRRRKEIIGDIDILVAAKPADAPSIMKRFTTLPGVESVTGSGATKSSVVLASGIPCDLRVVSQKEYPFALAYFTGSKEHNVRMRTLAKRFGWSLNEYAFTPAPEAKGKPKPVPRCASEEEIYAALKLSYVPPELREETGEIEAAAEGKLPRLIEATDLRGTFHCHTTYSDGTNTLAEMAAAAKALGWEYLGIADHSQVAAYARGLTPARVKEQHKEIDALNAKGGPFRIFKGTEVDILADGTLDFGDAVLASFDYVVASVHSKFQMTEAEATKRVIRALTNKRVTMLGHPTGRLLLERDGYPVNMTEVIKAAADHGKIIEINAHPMRLDLDWRLVRLAKEKGVKIAINPDAHATAGLADVAYGVGIARKGWLEKKDVVNACSLKQVLKFMNS
jgi:DNA polymerase (family 10)